MQGSQLGQLFGFQEGQHIPLHLEWLQGPQLHPAAVQPANSVCMACAFQKAVLAFPLVEHSGIFQRFEYFSHTNLIKLHKFFLRPFVPSHPQSIQPTVSHHIPAYKPGQTTTPGTLYAQCCMGCHPLPQAVSKSELKRNEKALPLNKQTGKPKKERRIRSSFSCKGLGYN